MQASNPNVIVKGEGPKDAKIVLVGQSPGVEEVLQKRPFVGSSGLLLNRCLEATGIRRSDCYITNVIKEHPPGNNIKVFFPTITKPTEKAQYWIDFLWKELEELDPNIIVPIGAEALYVLCGWIGIKQARGGLLRTRNGAKAIPIIHPAMALREWHFTYTIQADLKKIARESLSPSFPDNKRNLIIDPPLEEALQFIDHLTKRPSFAFDFETDSFWPYRIGLSASKDISMSISLPDEPKLLKTLWKALGKLFLSRNKKIGQNLMFDLSVLAKLGIYPQGELFDTMIAHGILYPELPKGLEFLVSIYLTESPYKKGVEDVSIMNAKDAVFTYEIAQNLEALLRSKPRRLEAFQFTMGLIEPVLSMVLKGIKCDSSRLGQIKSSIEDELQELLIKWKKVAGDVNPMSPDQLKNFFYSELGAPVQYHRKTGKVSTDETSLIRLAKKGYGVYVDLLRAIREKQKLLSTYIDMKLLDGRYHSELVLVGTETGRLSSRAWFGYGGNLQNIPRGSKIRDLFIADKDKSLLEIDLEQAEVTVVGWLSSETHIIQAIQEGSDIHSTVASIIFETPLAEIKDSQRYLAKKVVHAANYGMGYIRFQEELAKEGYHIEREEAKTLLDLYFKKFPNIVRWQESNISKLRKTREFDSLLYRQSYFMDRWGPELFRQAHAFVPQSTVGQVSLLGLKNIYEKLGDEVDLLLQVHDSILLQVHNNRLKEIIPKLKKLTEIPLKIGKKTFTIPVRIKVGKSWGSLELVKDL